MQTLSLWCPRRALRGCSPCVTCGWMIMPWRRSLSKLWTTCQRCKPWPWHSTRSGTFPITPSRTSAASWCCKPSPLVTPSQLWHPPAGTRCWPCLANRVLLSWEDLLVAPQEQLFAVGAAGFVHESQGIPTVWYEVLKLPLPIFFHVFCPFHWRAKKLPDTFQKMFCIKKKKSVSAKKKQVFFPLKIQAAKSFSFLFPSPIPVLRLQEFLSTLKKNPNQTAKTCSQVKNQFFFSWKTCQQNFLTKYDFAQKV